VLGQEIGQQGTNFAVVVDDQYVRCHVGIIRMGAGVIAVDRVTAVCASARRNEALQKPYCGAIVVQQGEARLISCG
jgi:hypothetical protein